MIPVPCAGLRQPEDLSQRGIDKDHFVGNIHYKESVRHGFNDRVQPFLFFQILGIEERVVDRDRCLVRERFQDHFFVWGEIRFIPSEDDDRADQLIMARERHADPVRDIRKVQ